MKPLPDPNKSSLDLKDAPSKGLVLPRQWVIRKLKDMAKSSAQVRGYPPQSPLQRAANQPNVPPPNPDLFGQKLR
jgi:hypothetical protein